MKLLYQPIHTQLNALSLLGEPLPLQYRMSFELAWFGHLEGDLFEVEIRKVKDVLGWLYLKTSIIFFKHKDQLYECWLYKLKELAEERLKEKKFTTIKEVNCLQRDGSGRIVGWVSMAEVLEISNKIEDEHR